MKFPDNFTTGMGDQLPVAPYSGLTVWGQDRSVRTFVDGEDGNLELKVEYFRGSLPRVGVDGLMQLLAKRRNVEIEEN